MAKYVIHKKGFFYTDEAFQEATGEHGSIVGEFGSLEEAKVEKENQDILSMQNQKGLNAVDFFFYNKKFDDVFNQMLDFYQKEFNLSISEKYSFEFPQEISREQAKTFLNILQISFHDIVEYDDDVELNPEDFDLIEKELGEF